MRRCSPESSRTTRCAAPTPATRRPSGPRSATSRWSRTPTLYLIAPASANTIAKLAHGHADTLVATAALAAAGVGGVPLLIAPAMNDRMYLHPAVQANLALLADRGVTIVGPGTGDLASHGEHGVGRMSEPAELLAAVEARLAEAARPLERVGGAWFGIRVLVTAGGTREPIDSVRYVGNRSSGRMGFALAERAARRGAEVDRGGRQRRAARAAGRRRSSPSRRRPSSRPPAMSASTPPTCC